MISSTQVDSLYSRVEKCKEEDRKREELLDELVAKLQATTEELKKTKLDLEHEISARRGLQEQNNELSSKLTAKPYVLVIVDADGYYFNGLNEGEEGGKKAADMLAKAVKEHIKSLGNDFDQCDIVVETYANTEGLGKTLVDNSQVRSINEWRHFWSGFVCRQRMFAHVDVGGGKEHADQRIRERVEFHSRIWQCKRVFLGCCHDAGYATFLGQFVSTGKITLLKDGVCHPKLEALGLPTVEFRGLFTGPVASGVSGASKGGKRFQNPFAWQMRLLPVRIDNKSGLRYDRPVTVTIEDVKRIEKMRLCHWFYLTGACKGCDRVHQVEQRLTTDEFDSLWTIARRGECYNSRKKKVCHDPLCIYGHKP
ncbi:hypothetical protein BU24DRAFT_419340 [Aaosphaeria arxii CBS 175.79]|uniref:DUF7923 domain-containing protein n=1 Tax=Aaosphaeria arxii CBS 175.79 TaxID=1450172 RepID=A0A6A5Y4A2_9PLEO|nr:uncharacterized protein BU24DRAFT_419340 [Aaosphaeria arxii CBS 175.79]KAF2019711.1 hypothetical protein BU24DRAFT_419340 [Aaosphaeria arxii CBS 175.79]